MFVSYKKSVSLFLLSLFLVWLSSLRLCFVCLFFFHDFSCLHVCMSVVVCILFVVLLFTEGTSVSEIYFHYSSKTDFSHFSCLFARIHFQLLFTFTSVLLREVNPTVETDPVLLCGFGLSWFHFAYSDENAFSRQKQTIFNWLILLVLFTWLENPAWFDWCVEIIRKKVR